MSTQRKVLKPGRPGLFQLKVARWERLCCKCGRVILLGEEHTIGQQQRSICRTCEPWEVRVAAPMPEAE